MSPTIGRIVHYKLTESDASAIANKTASPPGRRSHNPVREGDVVAAVVVAVFNPTCANLQVLLDGDCSYWATSRTEGDGPGNWSWPPRV